MNRGSWLDIKIRRFFFPLGAVRTIQLGPMRGLRFRVSPITGLSPLYSGPEHQHQNAFKTIVEAGDIVFDVGASWGLHALYLSRLVGPAGLVVALEPYPPSYTELLWHVTANGCQNVRTMAIAVSDAEGTGLFWPGPVPGTGRLIDQSGNHADLTPKPIPVPTRPLDSIIEQLGVARVKLVKIDVEGSEDGVLRGAEQTILRHRPHLVIDVHSPEQNAFAAQYLGSRSYKLSALSAQSLVASPT